jgi:hypothetical protein
MAGYMSLVEKWSALDAVIGRQSSDQVVRMRGD